MLHSLEHGTREFTCVLHRGGCFLEYVEDKHNLMFYSFLYSGREKVVDAELSKDYREIPLPQSIMTCKIS